MSVLGELTDDVNEVAEARSMRADRAFGYYFLEEVEEFSPEEAESIVVDGPWDGGRDAVYLDEENQSLTIYQLKYSEDLVYLRKAFSDIQRALEIELTNLQKCTRLRLVVVTIATSDESTHDLLRSTTTIIKRWLTNHKLRLELSIELFDLKKFAEFRDRLFGLDITLAFRTRPAMLNGTVLGLLNANDLKEKVDEEALFAFNIRKFLGARRGSVNSQIYATLEDPVFREAFWTLNNGIVCLCTGYKPMGDEHIQFQNFTIVNGAQTVSTIARFLVNNPAAQDPIWVVAKVIQVGEEEVERGRVLTKTSNSQAATNDKDLRAVDPIHRKLAQSFETELGTTYLYRRGTRAPRGKPAVTMKDIAQSYVAYWLEKPNVAFSRPGSIFSDSGLYERAFPFSDFDEILRRGNKAAIRIFLLQRLVPASLLIDIRTFLREQTPESIDRKWRSCSYHLLWILRKLFEDVREFDLQRAYLVDRDLLPKLLPMLFNAFRDFLETIDAEIPKDLKSELTVSKILERGFLAQSGCREVKRLIGEGFSHAGERTV
jgi:hypothetical protein